MTLDSQSDPLLPPEDAARAADMRFDLADVIHNATWCPVAAAGEAADAVLRFLARKQLGAPSAPPGGDSSSADPGDQPLQPFPRICPTCAGAGKVIPWQP
jgi:hypothetical protein